MRMHISLQIRFSLAITNLWLVAFPIQSLRTNQFSQLFNYSLSISEIAS